MNEIARAHVHYEAIAIAGKSIEAKKRWLTAPEELARQRRGGQRQGISPNAPSNPAPCLLAMTKP